MKIISYEDEHIRVIYQPGEGKHIVVTFGDMFSLASGDSFFAEKPVAKQKLNAIGFMAKDRNWFPYKSVENAIRSLRAILNSMDFRIVYGGSMGGYAALKFSKLLNADRVFSLVPQYSINPSLIKDHRYNIYFNEHHNADNAICFEDLTGEIFITHDPAFAGDSQHVDQIKNLGYPINYLPLRFSMHGATTILASSSFFNEITSAKDMTPAGLLSIYRERRHASSSYIESLGDYLLRRRPVVALQLLSSKLACGLIKDNHRVRNTVSSALLQNYTSTKNTNDFGIYQLLKIRSKSKDLTAHAVPIKTAHGRTLAYNSLTSAIVQCDSECIENSLFMHPIMVAGESGLVKVRFTDGESILVTHKNQVIDISDGKEYNNRNYIIYRRNADYYTISSITKNLSSSPNGRCEFNVDHVKAWEKYTPVTVQN